MRARERERGREREKEREREREKERERERERECVCVCVCVCPTSIARFQLLSKLHNLHWTASKGRLKQENPQLLSVPHHLPIASLFHSAFQPYIDDALAVSRNKNFAVL